MKIGIIALSLNRSAKPGFYNSQELGLGRALAKQGHSVIVYKLIDRAFLKEPEITCPESSLQYVQLPAFSLGINGFFHKRYLDKSMELLICFSDTQLYTTSVATWCQKHSIRMYPYIGIIESTSTNPAYRFIMNFLNRRLLRFYRKQPVILGKTPFICDILKEFDIPNPTLVPICLDAELLHTDYIHTDICELKKKWNYEPSDRITLFIGRLTAEKEPVEMIRIFAKAYQRDSSLRLCMIGKGELQEEVEHAIHSLHLDHVVRLLPSVPNDRIWELFHISNCFVNLNRHEIYGMAILEALYYECPVIAFHAPGPDYIIEEYRTAAPVPYVPTYLTDDTDELTDFILMCTEHETIIQDQVRHSGPDSTLAVNAKLFALFDWSNIVNQLHIE